MNDKDQTAIDHVASVSKHPHAAMVVKWLITGWDVEYKHQTNDIWFKTLYPEWVVDTEYRLIEPKPDKPAYRVYADPDGDLFVAERNTNGGVCQTFTEGCDWISPDWIEYDPPKKWPTPLVERIAAIDLAASQWILDNWDELSTDKYNFQGRYSRYSDKLKTMFSWAYSDIDINTWVEISTKLGE